MSKAKPPLPTVAELAAELMDTPNVIIELSPGDAFSLVGQLQLALRHPMNVKGGSEVASRIAHELQNLLGENRPAIAQAIAAGWDPEQDV